MDADAPVADQARAQPPSPGGAGGDRAVRGGGWATRKLVELGQALLIVGAASAPGHETVLVVEDEDAVRRLAARILKAAGYLVLTAANGGEALLLCEQREESIELLLTDVVMPRMSGKDLTTRLVAIRPTMRVLYMSGYTDNAMSRRGELEPSTRFIGKPFSATELTRKVREALDDPA